jgi:alpha-mannosidase
MKNGSFDGSGISFPAELFPETLVADGIQFTLGPKTDGMNNALACKGQKIILPKTGNFNHVYILAAALSDTAGIFKVGGMKSSLKVAAFRGNIGQADNRTWDNLGRLTGLQPGFIKRDEVAWFSTHLHSDTLVLPYQYGYICKYKLDASPASGTLQLPDNESIKIFAISVADNPADQVLTALPLYDDFTGRPAMTLNLTKSYVDENMLPAAKVIASSDRNIARLPARLTMKDYADIHQPNGVTANYFFTGSDTTLTGSGSITDGMNVAAINDGMYDLLPGDSLNDSWSETGEGRILMDLQKEIELDSIHIFTEQSTRRGAQSFSLWGSSGDKNPAVTGDPKASGWSFIALVSPRDVWGNKKALYNIIPMPDKSKQYRFLLWISEDSPHGPYYFREVDVFEKQK